VTALWLFLAVLGAPLLHAPVLRWNLLPALARPLDGGRRWHGRRLLGDNKTWRGALCMTAGVVLATLALWQWPWWRAQIRLRGDGGRAATTRAARATRDRDSVLGRYSIDAEGHTTSSAYGRLAVVDGVLVWNVVS
jgi:hypothetical protein